MRIKKSKIVILAIMILSTIVSGCKNQDLVNEDKRNRVDKYVCSTSAFPDIIPASVNTIESNDTLLLDGSVQIKSSEIISNMSNSERIVKTILEKQISDVLYIQEFDCYVTIECKDDQYSVELYDASGNNKNLYTTDEEYLIELSYNYDDGYVVIPVYTIDSEEKIQIKSIFKYDFETQKCASLDVTNPKGFDTPDIMLLSLKTGKFSGFISDLYNSSTKRYNFVKFDSELNYEFAVENNHGIIYSDENYRGFSFSVDGEKLLIHRSEADDIETDIYEVKSGKYIDTVTVLQDRNASIYDGVGSFIYCFNEDGVVKGVSEIGEVTDLFTTDYIIDTIYEVDDNICYAGHINRQNADAVYALNSDYSIEDIIYVTTGGKEKLEYLFSFRDEENKMYHLFHDEDEQCYLNPVVNGEENLIKALSTQDGLLYKYLTSGNELCGVYQDDSGAYCAIIYELKTGEERRYNLGELGSQPDFYLKNNNLYIINEEESGKTLIYSYDINSEVMNKLTELEDTFLKFTLKSSEFDFCCYSYGGIYGYKDNEFKLIFEWNKYHSIPEIYDVCVNNDSTYTIIGNDVKKVLNIYKFTKTDEPIPEKKTILLAENMNLNDIIGGETSSTRLLTAIDEFNQNDSGCFIQVQHVSDKDLNLMLLSDDAPDIIVSRGSIDPAILKCTKDLSEFIPNKLKNDPYSCSLIDLGKNNDEIHEVFPEYLFISLYGESQKLKNVDFSNIENFVENGERMKSKSVFYGITQMELFDLMIVPGLSSYTDNSVSKFKFDNRLIDLMGLIKNNTVPDSYKSTNDDELYNMYFSETEKRFSDDLCLLDISYMSLYLYKCLADQGEVKDPWLLGIPSLNNTCVPISPEYSLAVTQTSGCTEEAWGFIETLFSEAYQDNLRSTMPVLHSSLKKQSKSLRIKKNTFDLIEDMIEKNAVLDYCNESIYGSISDDVREYFNDGISGKELLRKMENKINLYNSETK